MMESDLDERPSSPDSSHIQAQGKRPTSPEIEPKSRNQCGILGTAVLVCNQSSAPPAALISSLQRHGISTADRKRLNKLVKKASSVLGCPLDPVEVVGEKRMIAKLLSLMENMTHPMRDTLIALGSSFGDRLLHPQCEKERYGSLLAKVRDWDPRGWWPKPQSSHSRNTIAVGPLSKALNPTLLPGEIGPWLVQSTDVPSSLHYHLVWSLLLMSQYWREGGDELKMEDYFSPEPCTCSCFRICS
ncbi:hypothetical protein JZ751_007145 [Albula glossodonta]|uniref:Uncharacterized protein n=1 Tax=Albula glossodonta TaxID=121402 RepID=A0A8T2P2U7_9TELE|nr:hypothetical protein JZ751_007145 [Albula glossodonta]